MGSARSCLLIRRVESMDSVLSTVASCGAPETIYLRLFDAGAHSPGCTDGVDRAWVCGEAGMRLVLRCTSMLLESKRALHVMCLSAKLLQPSSSSHGMRSHAEQRAGIALHAAHDPLQEDMRGIHSRATIEQNEHQYSSACRVVA